MSQNNKKARTLSALCALLALPALFTLPNLASAAGTAELVIPACPVTEVGGQAHCGIVRIQAVGGSVTMNITPIQAVSGDPTQFAGSTPIIDSPTSCFTLPVNPDGTVSLANGQTCDAFDVWFAPTSPGLHEVVLQTYTPTGAVYDQEAWSGFAPDYQWHVGSWGSWSSTCSANATHTREVYCDRGDGVEVADSFCPVPKPATSETKSVFSGCSYAWETSSWGPSSNTCSANATQTRTVWCERSDGTTVSDSNCSGTKPATSRTVSDFSGCTYDWVASSWGSCTGGTGDWQTTSWQPANGCGMTTQTRTATCVASPMSATQTRTVSCVRSDGTTVDSANCDPDMRPTSSQSCTPTSGFSCGLRPPETRTVLLTDACSYSWQVGDWGPSSDTCSATATQTRPVTCVRSDGVEVDTSSCDPATKPASSRTVEDYSTCSYVWEAGPWSPSDNTCSASAFQTRAVSCVRSDGTTVDVANCDPAAQPDTSRTVVDFSGCSYEWVASAWGSCTGGSAEWQLSDWTPTSGCGMTTQTRTATCVAIDSSGTQSRDVTCRRSDGTTVDDSLCAEAGPRPAASTSCTPSAVSCGVEPQTEREEILTDSCTYEWNVGAWSEWDSSCSETAQRTREVFCERSDEEPVDDSLCTEPKPAVTETGEVLDGCAYSWVEGGFGSCTGGTFSWLTGEWTPTLGCGEITQTRPVSCAVDAGSGMHSQEVTCVRSDGTVMEETFCDAGTRPAATESCTPDTDICVDPPESSRTVTLGTSCFLDSLLEVCRHDEGEFCVALPL